MMRWLRAHTRTRTSVHTPLQKQLSQQAAHARAVQTLTSVQLGAQLILWVTFGGYDRAVQTVWQSMLMLAVPLAVVFWLWKAGRSALESRAGRYAALALLVCLLGDAVLSLYALCGFIDALIPEYPYITGAAAGAVICWLTLLLSKPRGVFYGASAIRYPLVLLFLLGTVFLRNSSRGDQLWPILGQGFENTARAALNGSGAVWTAALLWALPKEETPVRKALLPAGIAFLAGVIWALWYGFVRPWAPGDALSAGERMMGLARHATGILNYQLAGLMWLLLLPLSLTGSALGGEIILTRAFPRLPRAISSGVLMMAALALVWLVPEKLPDAMGRLLVWRLPVCLAVGAALALMGWKGAKR